MQPWRHYLLAIIFYNDSMDTVGAAKLAALYILANTCQHMFCWLYHRGE